jgi:sporulation protein YqfC
MKKWRQWRENVVAAMEVPGDLARRDVIVTLIGPSEAVVENYGRILRYTSEKIVIQAFRGKVTICGKHLTIPCYTPEEMQVTGLISDVCLERQ